MILTFGEILSLQLGFFKLECSHHFHVTFMGSFILKMSLKLLLDGFVYQSSYPRVFVCLIIILLLLF